MTRSDFENKYLNKLVEVVLFDNDTFKGYLYSTNDYMKTTNRLDKKIIILLAMILEKIMLDLENRI